MLQWAFTMKIKTITCHDLYNYGSSLQAYALMKYLMNLGHDVEIIDYKPDYLTQRYNLFALSPRLSNNAALKFFYYAVKIPLRLISYRPRKKAFDWFTNNYLSVTTRTYHSNEELEADPPQADIYFAGSDQIWNTLYPNGKDPAFYLQFSSNTSVKASYAASFSINYIEKNYVERVKLWLQTLDYISVRESTGLSILRSVGLQGVQVMDPVFLLSSDEWQKLATGGRAFKDYILLYDFENNPVIENFAKKLSQKTGYQLVSITDWFKLKYANKNINNASPCDFLKLLINSSVFISNSFHGTAFSIIFNKEFYTFKRINQEVNSRMKDLLFSLELGNRMVTNEMQVDITDKINYNNVNAILNDKILFSKKYLDCVCNCRI